MRWDIFASKALGDGAVIKYILYLILGSLALKRASSYLGIFGQSDAARDAVIDGKYQSEANAMGLDSGFMLVDVVVLADAMGTDHYDWNPLSWGTNVDAVYEVLNKYFPQSFSLLSDMYSEKWGRSLVVDLKGELSNQELLKIQYLWT